MNSIRVTEPINELQKFMEDVKSKKTTPKFNVDYKNLWREGKRDIDFESIIPSPKTIFPLTLPSETDSKLLSEYIKENNIQTWYEWRNEYWGTKWNALNIDIQTDFDDPKEDEIIYKFDTAWNPPIPIFKTLVMNHPNLLFRFDWESEMRDGEVYFTDNVQYSDITPIYVLTSENDTRAEVESGRYLVCNDSPCTIVFNKNVVDEYWIYVENINNESEE